MCQWGNIGGSRQHSFLYSFLDTIYRQVYTKCWSTYSFYNGANEQSDNDMGTMVRGRGREREWVRENGNIYEPYGHKIDWCGNNVLSSGHNVLSFVLPSMFDCLMCVCTHSLTHSPPSSSSSSSSGLLWEQVGTMLELLFELIWTNNDNELLH